MSDAEQVQAEPETPEVIRRQFYAPWMIGVLIVFVICEVFFFRWGYSAAIYAMLGLFLAIIFNGLRCWQVARKPSRVGGAIAVVLMIFMVLVLLMPECMVREVARRMKCAGNLKQLGTAILTYESAYEQFPPAFVADKEGRPIYGWRVLMTPFVDARSFYDCYDRRQPWDSTDNQRVSTSRCPYYVKCPSVEGIKYRTNYVAVLGEDTLWPMDGTSRSPDDIKVDRNQVAMLIDINNSDIPWHEPRDVKLEDLLSGKVSWNETCAHGNRGAFYYPVPGRNIVFADGSVRIIDCDLTSDQIRRLFSITEPFDVEKELPYPDPQPIVYRYVVFFVWLAMLFLQFAYIFFPTEKELDSSQPYTGENR